MKYQKYIAIVTGIIFSFIAGFWFSVYFLYGMIVYSTSNADSLRALEAICYISYAKENNIDSVRSRATETVADIYHDQLRAHKSNYIYKKFYYNPGLVEKIEKAETEFPELREALDIARKKANR